MKPEDVRYHHIRDFRWPQKFCPKCGRMVPTFHHHYKKDPRDKIAYPEVKGERQ